MSEYIDFKLHGTIDGVEITPRTINLSQFNEFNRQVEEFIAGALGGKLEGVHVEIKESSYMVRALLSSAMLAAVDPVVVTLARQDSLGELDETRAKVVKSWQYKAKANEALFVEVQTSRGNARHAAPVRISHETNFRKGEPVSWVAVEKYIFGSVEEMGGSKTSNVHLRIPGSDKLLVVDSDKNSLKGRPVLYENVLLRVRAKENSKTGELKDIRLLEFADYSPQFDEAALDRFAEAGRVAWAGIPDAEAWLREIRGN